MRQKFFIALLALSVSIQGFAQQPAGQPTGQPATKPAGAGFDPSKMNVGRFYGKVVDENGKGVGYATVKLFGMKFDPDTRTLKEALLSGQLTEENGDFSLEKLPVVGEFTLTISIIGYAETNQKVTFGIKPPAGGPGMAPGGNRPTGQTPTAAPTGAPAGAPPTGMPGGGFPGMAGANLDKDLGNLKIATSSQMLQGVTVTAEASTTTLSLDKKIYRVDKDASAVGGNAQDALKNVPSLSVDIQGNVTLRNGAPQIFVDGRPSTLSLDQIPAASIESVEVITNPSAKYDAGGGTAGIVNIVLKKEKRLGYNGNARVGADSREGFNLGGDLNARGEKVNLFVSGNFNRNRMVSEGQTFRQNLFGNPLTNVTQTTEGGMAGFFANGRAGADFFLDNRNTLTLAGNYTRGKFGPHDDLTTRTDTLLEGRTPSSSYLRQSEQDRNFRNLGASVQFKHLFPKQGAEWTADLNYNRVRFMGGSEFNTTYDAGFKSREKQEGKGRGQFVTFQSDFVNPLTDKIKIEGGVRAAMRLNRNDNANYFLNQSDGNWVQVSSLADHYKFNDNVFAAYSTFSHQFKNWGYQAGLRAESSFYTGALTDRDSSFTIAYPIQLFPSFFVTRKLNEKNNLQFAYTRRVNRPNFFQTMPFIDFSDSLNLRRGNPQLLPEFTNSFELSYQTLFAKGQNLLVSVYYKQATNLITSYLTTEYNDDLAREVVVTTYANANSSHAYGAEATLKNNLFGWLDLTTNVNLFQAKVDADNVEENLNISRLSGFFKEVVQVKLPRNWFFQLNGEYRTRASFTPSNNNDPFRGGPGGGPSPNTAQGYSIANWYADASLRKDFLSRKASLTLSVSDIFRTRKMGTHIESSLFLQDTWSIRNPQTVRLNFSYRFGKMDTSLFKRKNMKTNMQGNDMM